MKNIEFDINGKQRKASDRLYGLFFEDINQSADGGINAELIINNSFEFEKLTYNDKKEPVVIEYDKLRFWNIGGQGEFCACTENGMNKNNPTFLRLDVDGSMRVSNGGFAMGGGDCGIALDVGEYKLSFFARNNGFEGVIKAFLENDRGETVSSVCQLSANTEGGFVQLSATLNALCAVDARLVLCFVGKGAIDIDYVSLLCADGLFGDCKRWQHGRLKRAFVETLKDVNPKFLRFPGGCIVEGDADFANMYMWKETVGRLWERRQKANTWGLMQSYALGFYEYFLLCEDLDMQPLPVVPCGLLCQIRCGQRGEGDRSFKVGTSEFYANVVENIAHLIYFARGNENSADEQERHWAGLRVSMGHKEPFKLNMLGVGNENWGSVYFENLKAALDALASYEYCGKKQNITKLFDITYVVSVGVDVRPHDTNESWQVIKEKYADCIVDEHCYNTAQWFCDNALRYDTYDRKGARVFMGEYAMHTKSDGRGSLNGVSNLYAAVSEAAFLTGCERNADIVDMTCYAPLLAKADNFIWTPDLIWFNNRHIMRTPSYFVQRMFASYAGNKTIEIDQKNTAKSIGGGVFVGAFDTDITIKSVKITDNDGGTLFEHSFANGLGDFRIYPGCVGGVLENCGIRLKRGGRVLNGYYLDGNYENCTVECAAVKNEGSEGVILGVALSGTKPSDRLDHDAYSLWLNYGCLDGQVAYEKRFDYMRVAFETINGKRAVLDEEINIALRITNNELTAFDNGGGKTEVLFKKRIHKINNKHFVSATTDGKNVFIKAVNCESEELGARFLLDRPNCTAYEMCVLSGDGDGVNSIDAYGTANEPIAPKTKTGAYNGKHIDVVLPPCSVVVIKI